MTFLIASTERGDPQTSQAGDEVRSCLWGGLAHQGVHRTKELWPGHWLFQAMARADQVLAERFASVKGCPEDGALSGKPISGEQPTRSLRELQVSLAPVCPEH